MQLPILTIPLNGRILSFKNSKQILLVKDKHGKAVLKDGKPQFNVITATDAAKNMFAIQKAAEEAKREQWYGEMLPKGLPFKLHVTLYVNRWTAPDGDGSLSTIMDSLQGVLFDNDRYCVEGKFIKIVSKNHMEVSIIRIFPLYPKEIRNAKQYRFKTHSDSILGKRASRTRSLFRQPQFRRSQQGNVGTA